MPKRLVIGVDPGPLASGLIVYEVPEEGAVGRVLHTEKQASLDTVRFALDAWRRRAAQSGTPCSVAVERTQAGPPSTAVVRTTEVVGRLWEACTARSMDCHLYYRRQVLQALGCARHGNKDSHVRNALIEIHGGSRQVAIGKKADPGPLYGVSSHAWQALGVVFAHLLLPALDPQDAHDG